MATKADLIGIGVSWMWAGILGATPNLATIAGATVGSATQAGGQDYLYVPISGTSGFKLPPVGGDNGALLGDTFKIFNYTAVAIVVFAANTAAGSTVTILANGTSAGGTTGMSLLSGHMMELSPITVSTWVGIKSSV